MLTSMQLSSLIEYCQYFRRQAEHLAREAGKNRSLYSDLRNAIIREQTRRARELTRLEKALCAELDAANKDVKSGCKKKTTKKKGSNSPEKKPAAKKVEAKATGVSASEKHTEGDGTKRKRGRPRKTVMTE